MSTFSANESPLDSANIFSRSRTLVDASNSLDGSPFTSCTAFAHYKVLSLTKDANVGRSYFYGLWTWNISLAFNMSHATYVQHTMQGEARVRLLKFKRSLADTLSGSGSSCQLSGTSWAVLKAQHAQKTSAYLRTEGGVPLVFRRITGLLDFGANAETLLEQVIAQKIAVDKECYSVKQTCYLTFTEDGPQTVRAFGCCLTSDLRTTHKQAGAFHQAFMSAIWSTIRLSKKKTHLECH